MVRFVTFFQRGGFILRPSFSQDCNCLEIYIAFVWSMIIQSSTQRPYGLFTSFAYRTVLLRNLHSACTGFIFTQLPYGPFEFNTVRYFFETFIQPVRVSFLHNYRTVFECNTPKEYTVWYNTSLSPTRGGGSSPSGSIPRPSPLVTRARMCSHSLTISNLTLPRCHVNFRVLNPVRLLGTCTVQVSCHTVRASVRTFGSHLDINTVRCYTSNHMG